MCSTPSVVNTRSQIMWLGGGGQMVDQRLLFMPLECGSKETSHGLTLP